MNKAFHKWYVFFGILALIVMLTLALCFGIEGARDAKDNYELKYNSTEVFEGADIGKVWQVLSDKVKHDNYLKLTLSKDDTYQLEFFKGDKSNLMIINSGTWAKKKTENGNKPILHKIPDYIVKQGYDKITITPIEGDGEYSLRDFETLNITETKDFSEYNVIDFDIKQLELEINQTDFKKIENKRNEALEMGILLSEDSDNVVGKIKADGVKYKAEMRLKGDWTDHLAGDKWSFRINLKGDHCIYGLQKFSIQPPETRNGIWEYLIYEMYREQGGVALRYDFADVFVNGVYKGVYAIEEFMEKRVIEHSKKREGPIICINEDPMWERWAFYDKLPVNYLKEFTVFSEKKTMMSSNLSGYAKYAITGINKAIAGEVPLDSVFNIDAYARLHAILDLFSSCHGRNDHNQRQYYNPVTALLEPIPFDEQAFYNLRNFLPNGNRLLTDKFFANEEHNKLYAKYLKEFADDYPDFIARHQTEIDNFITTILRDDQNFTMKTDSVNKRIVEIDQALNPENLLVSVSHNTKDNTSTVSIKNNCPLNFTVSNIFLNETEITNNFKGQVPLLILPYETKTISSDIFNSDNVTVQGRTLFSEKMSVKAKKEAFGFFTLGHAYGAPGDDDMDIPPRVLSYLSSLSNDASIDFGVFTGDLVRKATDEQYDYFKTQVLPIGKPYFALSGNHDLKSAEVYTGDEPFIKAFGKTYDYTIKDNNLIFFLDCDEDGWNISAKQIEMVKKVLAENPNPKNIFVLTHQLNWWEPNLPSRFANFVPNSLEGKSAGTQTNFQTDILPLFKDLDCDTYFIAGDTGAFNNDNEIYYEKDQNITYVASGVGGGDRDSALEFHVFEDGTVNIRLVALNCDDPNALGVINDYTRGIKQ